MATLNAIAQDMTDQARRTGASTRALPRGLHLQLAWVAGQKVLRLSRADGVPGAVEISLCRDAFDVPAGAERVEDERSVLFRWPSGGGM